MTPDTSPKAAPNALPGPVTGELSTEFLVGQDPLSRTRLRTTTAVPLADGQRCLTVESFALTANNITYALFGESMPYWQFFPTGEAGWACIAAWEFAVVAESRCDGVEVGEKFYGFFPMASPVVMQPIRVKDTGFRDGTGHQQALHVVYNPYLRCRAEPFHTVESEALQALLRPLFFAPAPIKKRSTDWGPRGLEARLRLAWTAFTARVSATGPHRQAWLVTRRHEGVASIEGVYRDMLGGGDPRQGHVVVP